MISTFTRYPKAMIRYIESPELLSLRPKGIATETYLKLNQPWFKEMAFTTVLDVGANVGRFAATLHAILPEAQIISFEPLPHCYQELQTRMAKVANFRAFNIGIGAQATELPFEQNVSLSSSSFLRMTELHKNAFPHASQSQTIQIKINTLDAITQQISITEPLLIKIDVQGFEDRVLQGGENILKRAKMILIETSFAPLYDGQMLFDGIYHLLHQQGFTYHGSLEQHTDRGCGKILQEDSIFIRP